MRKKIIFKSCFYALTTIVFAWALFLSVFACSTSAAVIDLSASSTDLSVGDSFSFYLTVSGLSAAPYDSLSAFDLDILFDETVFSLLNFGFSDVASGVNQLDWPEAHSFPFDGDVLNAGSGVLDVYGISGNSASVLDANQADAFDFLVLSFSAISESQESFISVKLNDPNLLFLDSDWGDLNVSFSSSRTSFRISDQTPIPEPSSLLLLFSGLGFALVFRRFGNSLLRKGVK